MARSSASSDGSSTNGHSSRCESEASSEFGCTPTSRSSPNSPTQLPECGPHRSRASIRGVNATDLYLSLLKGCLTRPLFLDEQHREVGVGGWRARVWGAYKRAKKHPDWRIVEPGAVDAQVRAEGKDWPENGETMIGDARLDNIQQCRASTTSSSASLASSKTTFPAT